MNGNVKWLVVVVENVLHWSVHNPFREYVHIVIGYNDEILWHLPAIDERVMHAGDVKRYDILNYLRSRGGRSERETATKASLP